MPSLDVDPAVREGVGPLPAVLGIDLGTSSAKVVLTDALGTVLRQSTHDYPVHRPRPGWAESDPQDWWSAVVRGVRDVLAARPGAQVAGIGLSGQMHGVVLADAAGGPTRPAVLWADARAEAELDAYRALPPDARARLANPLSPGMAGPILAWLARHDPQAIEAATVAVQPKDWVRGRLTGRWATEPSDASATLLYDVLDDGWSLDVVDAVAVPRRLLPTVLEHSAARAGVVCAAAAADLGLATGIPVAAGAADTAAAALGSGLLDLGTTQLTIGTGVQLVCPVPAPTRQTLPDPQHVVTHLYRAATRDGWYAMAAGLTGGATLGWVRDVLRVEWTELYRAARRRARADDPLFLPHLMGERTPYLDPTMRGAWLGLDARHDREALLYSALEGVAFAVADALEAMPRAAGSGNSSGNGAGSGNSSGGTPGRSLWLAGGGTTDQGWRELLADVLGAQLHAVQVPGASARGAAILGALAAGLVEEARLPEVTRPGTTLVAAPRPDDLLASRRARYRRAVTAVRPLT